MIKGTPYILARIDRLLSQPLKQKIGQPVPELPVEDVERAQQYYRDILGFEIGWLYPGKEIGAVSRGDVVIFFRRTKAPSARDGLRGAARERPRPAEKCTESGTEVIGCGQEKIESGWEST